MIQYTSHNRAIYINAGADLLAGAIKFYGSEEKFIAKMKRQVTTSKSMNK